MRVCEFNAYTWAFVCSCLYVVAPFSVILCGYVGCVIGVAREHACACLRVWMCKCMYVCMHAFCACCVVVAVFGLFLRICNCDWSASISYISSHFFPKTAFFFSYFIVTVSWSTRSCSNIRGCAPKRYDCIRWAWFACAVAWCISWRKINLYCNVLNKTVILLRYIRNQMYSSSQCMYKRKNLENLLSFTKINTLNRLLSTMQGIFY